MGQGTSVQMTQRDVDEVCMACDHVFDQKEVETLFWRFRSLDRGRKGFVTGDELLAIPELSINPLASRIARMLDGSNFKEFARFLAAFSGRASEEKKLKFMFEVYDLDGDGLLSQDDLRSMLSYMVGGELTEDQCQEVLVKCSDEAGTTPGVNLATFCKHADVSSLEVKVPTGF